MTNFGSRWKPVPINSSERATGYHRTGTEPRTCHPTQQSLDRPRSPASLAAPGHFLKLTTIFLTLNWGSLVGRARLRAGHPRNSGLDPSRGKEIIFSIIVKTPWVCLVSKTMLSRGGGGGLTPYGSGLGAKLTAYVHLVSRLRMGGAMPPLFHSPSWRPQREYYF